MALGHINWIKNPENNPEWVVGALNWIKNPENNPGRVVGHPNWIKNPRNDPGRAFGLRGGTENPGFDPGWGIGWCQAIPVVRPSADAYPQQEAVQGISPSAPRYGRTPSIRVQNTP